MIKDATLVLLAAISALTVTIVLVPDPTLRAVAVGALAGVVGGHLNGAQGTTPASQ